MEKRLFGVIGHPIGHSLSPAMHTAAFAHLGIDAEYTSFDVEPEDLASFLGSLAEREISGVNVTIPHKIETKRYLEVNGTLDKEAVKLGAVNTVCVGHGTLEGFNTDGPGFYRSLVNDLGFRPEGKRVVCLGAGGAASAIVMYLGKGPSSIMLYDNDRAKADTLAAHYRSHFKGGSIEVLDDRSLERGVSNADLLVNATPIGMKDSDPLPLDQRFLREGMSVYDLVYTRAVTPLVREARSRKLHATTGAGMLVYQGALAFELWTGIEPPVNIMRRALMLALGER